MDDRGHPRHAGVSSQSDRPDPAGPQPGPELLIGSNIFRNTNGVVKIDGKEQLVLEYQVEQGVLLLTIDLYGEAGDHIAHVRRNRMVMNKGERFTVDGQSAGREADLPSIRLWDRQSGSVVFEASAISERRIRISTGKFFSHKGLAVDITPHYCRIGPGRTLFGDIVENKGGTVVLG